MFSTAKCGLHVTLAGRVSCVPAQISSRLPRECLLANRGHLLSALPLCLFAKAVFPSIMG